MLNVLKAAPKPRLLVLEASGILELDFTAAQALLDVIGECRQRQVALAIARLESTRAQEAFTRFGIYDALPKDHVFRSVDEAIKSLAGKA
jgi:MFS superfamily sulfate permease-like transporter